MARLLTCLEFICWVLLVGAGSAGCVVANRLSKYFTVLLLEAGGEPNPLHRVPAFAPLLQNHPLVGWSTSSLPQKRACLAMNDQICALPRGKSLGGSGNLNYMIHLRGHPLDFDNWASITGDARWSYDSVLPFFKKYEHYSGEWFTDHYHGKDGELQVTAPPFKGIGELFVESGCEFGYPRVDLNANFTEGFSPIVFAHTHGWRFGPYEAFLKPVRNRKSITVLKFAHVMKILLEDRSNRAIGVIFSRHGKLHTAYASKEVVLSAGAINTPQILMLSGIGPKDHLQGLNISVRVDLPVGQNLQDHVSAPIGPFILDAPLTTVLERDVTMGEITEFLCLGGGRLTTNGVQASGFVVSEEAQRNGESQWPDIQYIFSGLSASQRISQILTSAYNLRPGVLQKFYEGLEGVDSFTVLNVIARPRSIGEVKLQSKDPFQPPIVDPRYYHDTHDTSVAIKGAKKLVEIIESAEVFKKYGARLVNTSFPGCEVYALRSNEYWDCFHRHYTLTVYHQCGTCSMGKKDSPNAVVSSKLQVLHTERLRVIDASVMPYVTSANINAPVIMLAEVGAQLILNTWKS